jgi:hypothetical protein
MRRLPIVRHLSLATACLALIAGTIVVAANPAAAAVPSLTTLNPAFGTWQGGVAVTITGTGFCQGASCTPADTAGTTVMFGTLPAGSVVVNSNTQIVATSPNATSTAAGTVVNVQVTNAGGASNTLPFTYSNCTFGGQIAGGVFQVTPGVSSIAIACDHLQANSSFLFAIVSPLAGVVTPFSVSADESLIMNNSPALPPSATSTAAGLLNFTLPIPAKTSGGNAQSPGGSATDGDGTCPPSQAQVNQGLLTCAVAVANLSGVNFGNALFEYPGQPTPQTPQLNLSPTGSSTTVLTASGTGWWGAGPGSDAIPAANIRIGCTGTNPCTGGTPAVSSNLKITGSSYFITCPSGTPTPPCTGQFTPSKISGTFDTGGATGTIAIDQPTTAPTPCAAPANCFPGNGPGGTTVEGTASSSTATATASGTGVATWQSNVPNNAISNAGSPPDPNKFWQPVAATSGALTFQVDLPAATTLSAVSETWQESFKPPTDYTIDTSPDGTTWTTRATVTGNTLKSRTDVFTGGAVTASHIRLNGITGYNNIALNCPTCGWAAIALVQLTWDGHGTVFPQAYSPNTTPWRTESTNTPQFGFPVISTLASVGTNGTTTYGYVVSAINGYGETIASLEKTVATGNATLSSTNFNFLAWTPVPGAVSYNVYGRTAGSETFLANIPATSTTCAPDTAPVPPCFSDAGTALGTARPPRAGTVESNALNNPGNQAFFWQPTSAAAAGAAYAVDLGSPTTISAATPTWSVFFDPPSAYEIDTSTDGVTWTAQFTTTTNTSRTATDVFPGGQVTASYMRIVINAPFPVAGTGYAGLALVQFSWNGVAATSTSTPLASQVFPQGYYPATLPNSATANATATWMNRDPNSGLFGDTLPRIVPSGTAAGQGTTSGSTTIVAAGGTSFSAGDVGRPIRGAGVGAGAYVATFVSCTTVAPLQCTITVTVPSTATAGGVTFYLGGTSWWQATGASGNTGNLVLAYDLGAPQAVSNVLASWLNTSFCPPGLTCNGFNPVNYQIFTSPNGSQNSWTQCANVTGNASFVTSNACVATGAVYVEFLITSWNAPTPYSGYGLAMNSLLIS